MLQKYSTLATLIAIYILAWMIQSSLLFNWDVSWGLHEASRLLAGGNYANSFFEPSPPMFLYLYSIPVIISGFFTISITLAFRLFIFMLVSLSLFICNCLPSSNLFLLVLAATFLALPLPPDFGQREHLFFILVMPYLLLVYRRLSSTSAESTYLPYQKHLSILIGLLAGIGFAIKPFFPITLIFIETYYAYRKKNWLAWLRPEIVVILALLSIYVLTIFLFHRAYITTILPLVIRYHYQSYHFAWRGIFLNPPVYFCGFTLLFYLAQYHTLSQLKKFNFIPSGLPWKGMTQPSPSQQVRGKFLGRLCGFIPHERSNLILLTHILLISLSSFILTYILQRSPWEYHILPAYSIAILLTLLVFISSLQPQTKKTLSAELVGLILLLLTFFSLYYQTMLNTRRLGLIIFILLLLSLCTLHSRTSKIYFMAISVLLLLTATLPIYHSYELINSFMSYKEMIKPLITTMRTLAPKQPVYFFSTTMVNQFPTIDYTNSKSISQYPSFAWLAGIVKQSATTHNLYQNQQLNRDKSYFINQIANELYIYKPSLVFVDIQANKPYLDHINFDYINEFSKYKTFRIAWNIYRYYATIEKPNEYKFAIYRRKE